MKEHMSANDSVDEKGLGLITSWSLMVEEGAKGGAAKEEGAKAGRSEGRRSEKREK